MNKITKALEDAGIMDAALQHIERLTEQALYHASMARDGYGTRHGSEDAAISSHLAWLTSELTALGEYVDSTRERTGR